jgi:very-short-patch-repair endonuclease
MVTSPGRTLVDLAPRFGDARLRRALDDAILRQLVQPDGLSALLAEPSVKVRRRTQVLRVALDLWLDGSEGGRGVASVSEATLLRVLRQAGVPKPATQHEIFDGTRTVGIADFAWPEHLIIVEMDGFRFHASPHAHANDLHRANRLAALGWEVLRISPKELESTPSAFLAALQARLGRTGRR